MKREKMKQTVALLRLFNAVKIEDGGADFSSLDADKTTVSNGYILDRRIEPTALLLKLIDSTVGVGGEKLNSTFHKSWGKVANAPIMQLICEQIAHYITTYGFESIGIYDGVVYIPAELLDIPEVTESIPLIFIAGLTHGEILGEIVKLGSSGIALSQETLEDIMVVIEQEKYDYGFIDEIKNRELHTILCDFYGIVPQEPVEYLRYVISKLTNESLLIKNDYLIKQIKLSNAKFLDDLLKDAPDNLGSIFYRFKPLFLAMKSISRNKTFFNRLRKSAEKIHEPMSEDYLNNVTAQIKHGVFDVKEFENRLQDYSVWRKIRLAHALNNRLSGIDSMVYKVRNGRGWVADFVNTGDMNDLQYVLNRTLTSISEDIHPNVAGRKFYIPGNIHYALPATQKQFVGNILAGTSVSFEKNLLIGVHWYNHESERVDIDLSLVGLGEKFGWDASYRSNIRDIMFSGDMTDAPLPKGASEFFYLKNGATQPYLLVANYFNFNAELPVDCQMIVADEELGKLEKNHIVDPSCVVLSQSVTISKKQNTIGLILGDRVYFVGTAIGNSITSSQSEHALKSLSFFEKTLPNSIDLSDLLVMAGGTIVNENPSGDFVNLSQEALNKNSFLDIFRTE